MHDLHRSQTALCDSTRLFHSQWHAHLSCQTATLKFFLQPDQRRIPVIIPDPELLPRGHPIDFLPKCPIPRRVKIQTPDLIASLRRMAVRHCDGPKPAFNGGRIRNRDLMLPLMTQIRQTTPSFPVLLHFKEKFCTKYGNNVLIM